MTDAASKPKRRRGCLFFALATLFVLTVLLYGPVCYALKQNREIVGVSQARSLGLILFAYANDHNGKYPVGKTSTEVFQQLLDQGYPDGDSGSSATFDPTILYYPMPGKVEAPPGTKILKPENVCFDVTIPVDSDSSDSVPMVFLSGYKVTYAANANAVPLPRPPLTWLQWWEGDQYPDFIIVIHKSNAAHAFKANPDGSIPNFIPSEFTTGDYKYIQLSPDGPLGP